MLEKIGAFLGLGKNPLKSWTIWGLVGWQASSVIADLLCGGAAIQLPEQWCGYANAAVETIGQVLVVLGIRRKL